MGIYKNTPSPSDTVPRFQGIKTTDGGLFLRTSCAEETRPHPRGAAAWGWEALGSTAHPSPSSLGTGQQPGELLSAAGAAPGALGVTAEAGG